MALSVPDRKSYVKVKDAVLKMYELVPEAYRLRFRSWRKGDKQTYTEVARELNTHFNRWCSAVGVTSLEELSNLIVLEQFRNILPERVATYISERKLKTAAEAAVVADDFALIHKQSFREQNTSKGYREQRFGHFNRVSGSSLPATLGLHTQNRMDVSTTRPHKNAVSFRRDSGFSVSTSASPSKKDGNVCHYCLDRGHWKKDCPVLKGKSQRNGPDAVRGVTLAVSASGAPLKGVVSEVDAKPVVVVNSPQLSGLSSAETGESSGGAHLADSEVGGNGYSPFIT